MTTESETLKRRSFHGTEGGMDHAATAELYREVVSKKGKARKATQLEEGDEELDEDDNGRTSRRHHKLVEVDRATLRMAWTGALKIGERLWGGRTQDHTHMPTLQNGSQRNGRACVVEIQRMDMREEQTCR